MKAESIPDPLTVDQRNMTKPFRLRTHLHLLALSAALWAGCSTKQFVLPPELVGIWQADSARITVRTSPKWMRFIFTPGAGDAVITVHGDKTASGRIGSAEFRNARIIKNGGNPEKTGVAYIIRCGPIGRIFPGDPVESKEVELWLGPMQGDMQAELRFTENGAQFPMGDFRFRRVAPR